MNASEIVPTRMLLLNQSVPVKLADTWGGMASSSGLLRFENEVLALEFETKDGVLEIIRSGIQRLALPVADLEGCAWHRGWFGGRIEIAVRRLALLSGVPGAERGTVVVRVARKDRDKAAWLVTEVNVALARHGVRAVEDATRPRRTGADTGSS